MDASCELVDHVLSSHKLSKQGYDGEKTKNSYAMIRHGPTISLSYPELRYRVLKIVGGPRGVTPPLSP